MPDWPVPNSRYSKGVDWPESDLSLITPGERLFLWRHRQCSRVRGWSRWSREHRTGSALSVRDAAYELRIGERRYIDMEKDRAPVNGLARLRVGNITLGERCLLARRRSGLLLSTVYQDIGVSKPKFHELEKLGDPKVISYWRSHGFRFPPKGIGDHMASDSREVEREKRRKELDEKRRAQRWRMLYWLEWLNMTGAQGQIERAGELKLL